MAVELPVKLKRIIEKTQYPYGERRNYYTTPQWNTCNTGKEVRYDLISWPYL